MIKKRRELLLVFDDLDEFFHHFVNGIQGRTGHARSSDDKRPSLISSFTHPDVQGDCTEIEHLILLCSLFSTAPPEDGS